MKDLSSLREEYRSMSLSLQELHEDPLFQFNKWFKNAVDSKVPEPNAMTLSTVDEEGRPSARIVLLKSYGPDGFVFYTNYRSKKSRQISHNAHCSLVFWWIELARQVRIEGIASKVSEEDSEEYFASRPRGSQLGAWVSMQSSVLESRKELDDTLARLEKEYESKVIPRPPHWGGFTIKPDYLEFWQGRENRLHDRFSYQKTGSDEWRIDRLAP